MKFDFAIGNPPYQETMEGTSDNPVYNDFMDAAYGVADRVELITPARFLFNAGKTPKAWNNKMLNDEHFKVMKYEPNAEKIFSNTEIKGGIVITYRSSKDFFGKIEIFTQYQELNTILIKVRNMEDIFVDSIVYSPESYKFIEKMYDDNPQIREMTTMNNGKVTSLISKGHDYDLTSNIFEKLAGIIFYEKCPNDDKEYVRVLGRKDNARCTMWVRKDYLAPHDNLERFKLAFPKVNGNGAFGEVLTLPEIIEPMIGHTQTFLSMGAYYEKGEAINLDKYLKTKFARTLLGVLKVTQDNKKGVWKFVPLQDFTEDSDINWNTTIANIDQQLYKKYGLTQEEIDFIETNVKEMK